VPVHPAARAVLTASVIIQAVPRAEWAFPPRSRVAAITGAASGGQTDAASTFRAAHQQALAADLRVPERRALLGVPVDPFLLGVDIDEGQDIRPGQQRGTAGQLRQDLPVDLAQLKDIAPGERAQERPQRGRRADIPEQHRQGAVTQQPMSSMLSAPAAIPAARQAIFTGAVTPHGRAIRTCSAARSPRPARCARAITGTKPACDTRCGSSNLAWVFASSCNNRT